MFERMLDHPNIKVMLNTDFAEIRDMIPHRRLIYTGPVDAYFGYRFGALPYRSLEFRFETHDKPVFQPTGTVNYPNDYGYTRVSEFKYLTGQEHSRTTVVYEYPRADGDPYYPVPRPENAELYKRYEALAAATPEVHFVGRLATYKYYNMDQVVGQALATYKKIEAAHTAPPAVVSTASSASATERRGPVAVPVGAGNGTSVVAAAGHVKEGRNGHA
jgi:UDP-galactopyranose mutase